MKVLITGGTGMIGTAISELLLQKGYSVQYLSRSPGKNSLGVQEFKWDVEAGYLDPKALNGVEAIINLAGAPINKRWSPEYKSEILRSRVDSTRLLFNSIQKVDHQLKAFISASAVGYYPNSHGEEYSEEDAAGRDFLSLVCQKWETEAQNFEELGVRTLRMRIGIVLSQKGGALPKLSQPVKLGLGAPLGSGKQWMPWIHLQDLAGMFTFALENESLEGPVNAAGPSNVTNRQMTQAIANALHRPLFLPPVPAFVLKTVLGEMAETILASNKVSTQKIKEAGFKYQYKDLANALEELF